MTNRGLTFEKELVAECDKLILRFERYARELRDGDRRRERRTGIPSVGKIERPESWSVDDAFNPYKVRSNSSAIARAVELALKNHNYRPRNPFQYDVIKSDGSLRPVSVFAIADATVSRRLYKSLLFKNKSRFSAYSYAYRDDLTAHDAIQNIGSELASQRRVFLAEYDFTKYFQSIEHEYLWKVLTEKKFLMSTLEEEVLRGFLGTELQTKSNYQRYTTPTQGNSKGIPQGTSVSLFLANVAAWELDRALERLGVGFARYADDTLIWSHDYGRICDAVEVLSRQSEAIGGSINFRKSLGISIFAPNDMPAEFNPKSSVEFVGYRFSTDGIGMRGSVTERVKSRIAYIVWSNLLEPLMQGHYVPNRVLPNVDRDYLVMVMQLRRYLYGGLSEAKLKRLRSGRAKRIQYPGLMSFFPLVDDEKQLKALDGWMLHTIHTSLNKRAALLRLSGATSLPSPHGLSKYNLIKAVGHRTSGGRVDLQLPSFVRVGSLIRKAAIAHGPNAVGRRGGPQHYHYAQTKVIITP